MKKEYSALTKNISAIVAVIISYFLMVLKVSICPDFFSLFESVYLNMFMGITISFLCISIPVVVSWCIFRYPIYNLFWGLPIIFLSVLIYSPDGWYFIWHRGPLFFNFYPTPDWKDGLYISIMFSIVQFIAVGIVIGIYSSIKEKSKQKSEHELESTESEKQVE